MPTATPDVETDVDARTKQLPPYAVVLHNDDVNTWVFVVAVLQKVFAYPTAKCVAIMAEAHTTGRAVAWVGPLEVAELKADQIHSCGPDPHRPTADPLRVTVEPA